MILSRDFYLRDDVILIAKELLGKVIVSKTGGKLTSGIIVETEAYQGPEDKASHAYGNRMTQRTKTMFKLGGTAYIYLNYGIHSLFNVVTNREGIPHAVLIRAIEPLDGLEIMMQRRKMNKPNYNLSNGPGKLTQALGITTKLNGIDLCDDKSPVTIEDRNIFFPDFHAGPRVGIDYAGEYKYKPWRFRAAESKWTGK